MTTCLSGPASAQTITELPRHIDGDPTPVLPGETPKPAPKPKPTPPDDGLGDRGFYLEADTLARDDPRNVWTAEGGVEARYQGRVMRADKVVYDVAKGVVTADGHVQLINEDGTTAFASHMVLDDKMRAGFAAGFSARAQPQPGPAQPELKFAADVAIRRSAEVDELDRAIFTPCDICAKSGAAIQPTWSISASKIIEDQQKHVVFYRNAVIRVKGLPLFYTPVFWHADPNAPRSSGLLVPSVSIGKKRGFTYDQPGLWVVSPSAQLTIDPQINSKVNPFLNLDWTERFYSGEVDARVGYTYEKDFDGTGNKFGDLTSRSFILANGQFNLTPQWTWGFTAERASDPLIFIKYDITNPYGDHGLFLSDSQRLLSQAYLTRQDDNSYLSIAALDVQGLRTTDNNATFPLVAPLI
ncbi:MAG TPA: LPS assembly protein LptD, partial [Caulobacteraceae bacterium]|nr:LPS assembly protein LptD [Caulobacteraceae bacterium]